MKTKSEIHVCRELNAANERSSEVETIVTQKISIDTLSKSRNINKLNHINWLSIINTRRPPSFFTLY